MSVENYNSEFRNTLFQEFESTLNMLNEKYLLIKNTFLITNYIPLDQIKTEKPADTFVCQLYQIIEVLMFSKNDSEVTEKLIEMGIANRLLQKRADLNEISKEIIKLFDKNDFFIRPSSTLYFIHTYFFYYYMSIIYDFYLPEVSKYGHSQSEIMHNLKLTGRKLERIYVKNKKSDLTKSLQPHELLIYEKSKDILNKDSNLSDAEKTCIQRFNLKNLEKQIFTALSEFHPSGGKVKSKNQFYKELVPLIKTFIVDKELLDEEAFKQRNGKEYDNYEAYVISRVKKILRVS